MQDRLRAEFVLVCLRQTPDLDVGCDDRLADGLAALAWALGREPTRDQLLALAEEYLATVEPFPAEFEEPLALAVARMQPPPPPEPDPPDPVEEDIRAAEALGVELDQRAVEKAMAELCETEPAPPVATLPVPGPQLMPQPDPPGVVKLANGSVLIFRDLESPDHFGP
jgi:hypothetical protein